jgi:hypothetical protein
MCFIGGIEDDNLWFGRVGLRGEIVYVVGLGPVFKLCACACACMHVCMSVRMSVRVLVRVV